MHFEDRQAPLQRRFTQARTQYQASRPSVGTESASGMTHNDGGASLSKNMNTPEFSKGRRGTQASVVKINQG